MKKASESLAREKMKRSPMPGISMTSVPTRAKTSTNRALISGRIAICMAARDTPRPFGRRQGGSRPAGPAKAGAQGDVRLIRPWRFGRRPVPYSLPARLP